MASYHFGADGKPVKCNTVDPNGVCRIHGNTDIQANSAEEAQQKYNAMKIDEAKAEDMSEMPPEYAVQCWKIHCDAFKNGDDDKIGPKTVDAIANKPEVWESLDEDCKNQLADSVSVEDGNQFASVVLHLSDDSASNILRHKSDKDLAKIMNTINDDNLASIVGKTGKYSRWLFESYAYEKVKQDYAEHPENHIDDWDDTPIEFNAESYDELNTDDLKQANGYIDDKFSEPVIKSFYKSNGFINSSEIYYPTDSDPVLDWIDSDYGRNMSYYEFGGTENEVSLFDADIIYDGHDYGSGLINKDAADTLIQRYAIPHDVDAAVQDEDWNTVKAFQKYCYDNGYYVSEVDDAVEAMNESESYD